MAMVFSAFQSQKLVNIPNQCNIWCRIDKYGLTKIDPGQRWLIILSPDAFLFPKTYCSFLNFLALDQMWKELKRIKHFDNVTLITTQASTGKLRIINIVYC